MRTTLDIDEAVLHAVKSLARQRGATMGQIVSELLAESFARDEAQTTRNGLPVFPASAGAPPATMELVNRLRDGDEA